MLWRRKASSLYHTVQHRRQAFSTLKNFAWKSWKKKLSSKMIYFWISQMSHASKHPCHALHSAKMFFGPIMETTMKHAGFDPNYLEDLRKTALKLWAITCRGSWSPFDLKTHQNADTIGINLLIKPWMPHFCVSINSANPAWGFSTFISQSRQRDRERHWWSESDTQRDTKKDILCDIEQIWTKIRGFFLIWWKCIHYKCNYPCISLHISIWFVYPPF